MANDRMQAIGGAGVHTAQQSVVGESCSRGVKPLLLFDRLCSFFQCKYLNF